MIETDLKELSDIELFNEQQIVIAEIKSSQLTVKQNKESLTIQKELLEKFVKAEKFSNVKNLADDAIVMQFRIESYTYEVKSLKKRLIDIETEIKIRNE